VTTTTNSKIETARVLGGIIIVGSLCVAAFVGPNLAIAATRGRASAHADLYLYAFSAWALLAGVGLGMLRKWGAAMIILQTAAAISAMLIMVARNSTPTVFFLNFLSAAMMALPAAGAWWCWPVLSGSKRKAAPN
jgi:hypothetical protein